MKTKEEAKRRIDLDILKVIGLLCIIFAHANPPDILFRIRNFDVVLMILISAYLGLKTYKNNTKLKDYYLKRFKRLVLPTWIFLIPLLIYINIITPNILTFNIILDTFILNNGIGFVWVIRIYLIIALLIPLCRKIINKYNNIVILISTLLIYIIYELLCHYGLLSNPTILYLFAYIIPCYVLIILANYLFDNNKVLYVSSIISLLLFALFGYILYKQTGAIQSTQVYKYPFRIYYLSYGIFISSILIFIFKNKLICNLLNNKLITFISSHSLWIYLWHMFIHFTIVKEIHWLKEFLILLVLSILITYIQAIIVNKLEGKVNKNILAIFKG